jgi:hypothetical protein
VQRACKAAGGGRFGDIPAHPRDADANGRPEPLSPARVDPTKSQSPKPSRSPPPLKVVQFLALVLTALALVPAGAHLFALPNKINFAAEQYFIVQNIYRGWSLFGIVLAGALVANLALAVLLRGRGRPFVLALIAFLCIAVTLTIFFVWTYPANQATTNWTTIPNDWEELRRQWEYSHAANALVTLVAFCSVVLSVLTTRD